MRLIPAPLAALAIATLLLGACGSGDTNTSGDTVVPDPAATERPPVAAPASGDNAPLAVEDIDRWKRGMEAERKSLQDAAAQRTTARTATDSANAVAAMAETSTLRAGAAAAGVSEERYQFIGGTLGRASAFLAPDNDLPMTAEMKEQARQGREQQLAGMSRELPPQVMEALRAQASALRQQELRLVAERLKLMEGR